MLESQSPDFTKDCGSILHKQKYNGPREKSYDKPRLHTKKQRHHFANKIPSSQSYGFSSSCMGVRVGL